jgi:putative nucleotidyltransferase with HDIG domain
VEFSAATQLDPFVADQIGSAQFLTRGDFPVGHEQFTEMATFLKVNECRQPVVVNEAGLGSTQVAGFPLRNLVIAPLTSAGKTYGYLAAANHEHGGEFGTVEARLLGSVATILGIHCGNIVLYREQSDLFAGVVRALSSAIDAKDPYTCGHSDRVARVAVRLAEELGLPPDERRRIHLAGLLHDIGKIGIKDEVLRKPGKLTPEEYEHIKLHPALGYEILKGLKKIQHVLPAVLHHHESWDGQGYPHGLAGEAIPLIARIIAVADAFDAMGSDRPYRKGMQDAVLDKILREGAGKQWDVRIVDAFFRARDDIRTISKRERESLKIDLQPA